jgi:hypothetical protein
MPVAPIRIESSDKMVSCTEVHMFVGFNKKETVLENGLFYLCGVFQIQYELNRTFTPQE